MDLKNIFLNIFKKTIHRTLQNIDGSYFQCFANMLNGAVNPSLILTGEITSYMHRLLFIIIIFVVVLLLLVVISSTI